LSQDPGTGGICFEEVFPFDGISVIFVNLALVNKSKYFDKYRAVTRECSSGENKFILALL